MSVLDDMLDDPRNAVRSPRSTLLRTTAAVIGTAILLAVLALSARYVAGNWREIVYGQTATPTVINPEDGASIVSNEMSRMRGVSPLSSNGDKLG